VRTEARALRILAESKLQNRHPREVELVPDPLHLRRDDAKILRDDRKVPDFSAAKRSPPGPFTHCPVAAVVAPAGISQYASNPRKWSILTTSYKRSAARKRSTHQP
jgi:hypothetical protein